MAKILMQAKQIQKSYSSELAILKKIDLDIFEGDDLSIVGQSGAGKSTLLHVLSTLDRPDSGEIFFKDKNLLKLGDQELSQIRNQKIGFVFQFHHLLQEFTALENVMIPSRIAGDSVSDANEKARLILKDLGLESRLHHFPAQLSGGELQRVSIARAIVKKPQILFADEPTGNLDSQNSLHIQELFFDLKKRLNLTLVVVTHDAQFASKFTRKLKMSDGHWL